MSNSGTPSQFQNPYYGQAGPEIEGVPGGADALANQLSAYGASAQQRTSANIAAPMGPNAQAASYQQMALAALQRQSTAPGAAGIGMSAGIGGNLGAAYAARGMPGAGAALAGQNQGVIGQGGGQAQAQQGQAYDAMLSGYGALAGQANQQYSQDSAVALAQAQLQEQQQQANNAAQIGYQGLATNVGNAQLQSDTNAAVAQSGDAAQLSQQSIAQQAALNSQLIGGAAGAAASGVTAVGKFAQGQSASDAPAQSAQSNADTGLTDDEGDDT